jgi:nucleoside 2-deoxyribosyltransferase
MPSVYLAGFDVFRPDARDHGRRLKDLCSQYGFDGLYPLDNEAPLDPAGRDLARWIFEANIGLLRRADAVMANLNPFRGAEPDSGTVFEVGWAVARGIPVWAYTEAARPLVEQIPSTRRGPDFVDAEGYTVEDFGLNLNLMIACSVETVIGDAQACLRRIAGEMAPDEAAIQVPGHTGLV